MDFLLREFRLSGQLNLRGTRLLAGFELISSYKFTVARYNRPYLWFSSADSASSMVSTRTIPSRNS